MSEVNNATEAQNQKPCPYCGEMVNAMAKKCKHCGEIIDPQMRELENLKQAQHNNSGPIIVNNNNNNNNGNGGGAPQNFPFVQKSRMTYIILAILFGWLGIHDFYAGRSGMGILCILATCCCGASVVIILLEILFVKSDGRGIRFK